jgi:hypothetical protein
VTAARHRTAEAAHVYAVRGWPVLPCHSLHGATCSCGHADCASAAKHPRIAGGLRNATVDHQQIEQWWRRWPDANVAIRTGAQSGLVVLDIDPRHGGEDTLKQLQRAHGVLPPGRSVETGGGGLHLYFRHPGIAIRNDAGRRLGPGVDVRGDGGYVVAPPSGHASGDVYRLRNGSRALPDLPEWIRAQLQPTPAPRPSPLRTTAVADAWARAALNGELDRLASATEGTRNDTLNRVAYRLGQIIGAGLLPEEATRSALIDQAIAVGLGGREADATTDSGLSAGRRNPAGPREPDHDDLEVSA